MRMRHVIAAAAFLCCLVLARPVDPADTRGPERFLPSEEVSADLSVPFPVDI